MELTNKLTRKILIEKHISIFKYNHPKEVPNKVWMNVFTELVELKDSETLEYIAEKILCPLRKQKGYQIWKSAYYLNNGQTYHQIIFNGLSNDSFIFNIPVNVLYNYRKYFTREDISKYVSNFIIQNWD